MVSLRRTMQKWPALALGALSLVACKDPPKGAPTAAASTSAPSAGSAGGSVVASGSAPSAAPSVPAAPAASGSGAVVAFTLRAPAVGDETEEREQLEVHLALDVGAGTKTKGVELTQKDAIVRKTKVLAVDGKAVTKVQVTYVERSESVSQNGKEKKGQSPVTGHTYVLTARDGKLEIADDKGAAVPAEEARFVLRSHRSLGKPDAVLAGLPASLRIGDEVPTLVAALEQRMHGQGDDAPSLSDVKVKLASIEDGFGVFDLSFTMKSGGKGGSTTESRLKGTLRVRTSDALVGALVLEGTIAILSTDKKGKTSGTGDMKMSFVAKR